MSVSFTLPATFTCHVRYYLQPSSSLYMHASYYLYLIIMQTRYCKSRSMAAGFLLLLYIIDTGRSLYHPLPCPCALFVVCLNVADTCIQVLKGHRAAELFSQGRQIRSMICPEMLNSLSVFTLALKNK